MNRKQFLRLTGFSAAALFFNRSMADPHPALSFPSKVHVFRDGKWVLLTGSKEHWNLEHLTVELDGAPQGMRIKLHAPGMALEKIRLSWEWPVPPGSKYLGDAWERSYGDLGWESADPVRAAPWYLLIHDGHTTHAFGVKTGARCFCSWQAGPGMLQLILDTHSGGSGVELGDRVLPGAEIVTLQSKTGETPFQTDARFCRLMCENPRL